MSITKTMTVGRRKLPVGKRKVSWSLPIEPELLAAIRKKSAPGKTTAWARSVLWDAINK
jgi:hypothetical protein